MVKVGKFDTAESPELQCRYHEFYYRSHGGCSAFRHHDRIGYFPHSGVTVDLLKILAIIYIPLPSRARARRDGGFLTTHSASSACPSKCCGPENKYKRHDPKLYPRINRVCLPHALRKQRCAMGGGWRAVHKNKETSKSIYINTFHTAKGRPSQLDRCQFIKTK